MLEDILFSGVFLFALRQGAGGLHPHAFIAADASVENEPGAQQAYNAHENQRRA